MPMLDPRPAEDARATMARHVREEAAALAATRRPAPQSRPSNGEAHEMWPPVATFTKSLPHDAQGFVDPDAYDELIAALNQSASSDRFTPFPGTYRSQRRAAFEVTLNPKAAYAGARPGEAGPRTLESPLAGHLFDLEGPDADAVAMPPAPAMGSDELVAEMAEVYAMALLRDVPFNAFEDGASDETGAGGLTVSGAVGALNRLAWFDGTAEGPGHGALSAREEARRRARTGDGSPLTAQTVFRGSTPGSRVGPYISQFLLIGNTGRGASAGPTLAAADADAGKAQRAYNVSKVFVPDEAGALFPSPASAGGAAAAGGGATDHAAGAIQYGQQVVSQKMIPHEPGVDHMQSWADWLDVQNGLDTRARDRFLRPGGGGSAARFIHTPRDLATYVHFDALYQAYLNACLILLGQEAPFDAGLPEGQGHPTRAAFATFGGPHILTLVTEVATRALKAVRRQKFQIHLRARPEAIGGALTLASAAGRPARYHGRDVGFYGAAESMIADLKGASALHAALQAHGGTAKLKQGEAALPGGAPAWLDGAENWLLPMAFPEGSPVHGSYGAGHATVAGACVTVLKAFFEMFDVEGDEPGSLYRSASGLSLRDMIDGGVGLLFPRELTLTEIGPPGKRIAATYRTHADGSALVPGADEGLTVQGELDKLAANISIGRDWAGVHYYTDYYESLRMGERVAVGLLQEQMLTYREPLSMRFT